MHEQDDDVQISKLEIIFMIGIIGCMLFATWELGYLTADKWLLGWVSQNSFVHRRVILYGIAFFMSIASKENILPKNVLSESD